MPRNKSLLNLKSGRVTAHTSSHLPQVAHTLVLPASGTYAISIVASARQGETNRGMYKRSALFYRSYDGPATLQGAVGKELTIEAYPSWDVTMVTNGDNVDIQVTGSAGAEVDWSITFSTSILT